MTSIEFIKGKLNGLKKQLNFRIENDFDFFQVFQIKAIENEISHYEQILADLEKLEKIENMRRDWSNGGK